jgi:hypothetical protein
VPVELITFCGEGGLARPLFGDAVLVVLRDVAWQRRDVPRPMATTAHASSAVCAGASFKRASSGESST